jgi:ribosomal protein S27E
MAFKLQDFKCKDCEHVTEIFLDSRIENQEIECEECKSKNLEPIISAGTGNKSHVSWAKWRTSV